MNALLAAAAFALGIGLVIFATDRLVDGLVGVAALLRVAPFVATVLLSGLEAENVAVGLAAGQRGASDVALGTALGGATFLMCMALGLGALIAPLELKLPRGIVMLLPLAALLAGLPLLAAVTPRWSGIVLLVAFAGAMAYLVRAARQLPLAAIPEAGEGGRPSPAAALLLTVGGILLIGLGGELVAIGAQGLIGALGLASGLMGMVITPAAIESEEVVRQAVPARRGRPDISAGNLVGTVLYFTLFNLGLIALITPVAIPDRVRLVDWPFLVMSAVLTAVFLLRGRVGRWEGAMLVGLGLIYAVTHAVLARG